MPSVLLCASPGNTLPAGAAPAPQVPGLDDLATKYQLLLALNDDAPPGRTEQRRRALRQVAERYPTALREWEALPREELVRRHEHVQQALAAVAARGSAALRFDPAPWLRYALVLHPHLRALLALRRLLVAACATTPASVLWEQSPLHHTASLAAVLERVRHPPGGSLVGLAYEDVARHHGVTAGHVKATLFTAASPAPHHL